MLFESLRNLVHSLYGAQVYVKPIARGCCNSTYTILFVSILAVFFSQTFSDAFGKLEKSSAWFIWCTGSALEFDCMNFWFEKDLNSNISKGCFWNHNFHIFFLTANGCQVDMIPQERIASSRLENYHAVLVSNLVILKNLFKKNKQKKSMEYEFFFEWFHVAEDIFSKCTSNPLTVC